MKKPRVYYHSKTDTAEDVAKRVTGKLRTNYGVELFTGIPQITESNKKERDTYIAEAHASMQKQVYEIDKLYIAATTAASYTDTIKVLSAEAVLIDLDKNNRRD